MCSRSITVLTEFEATRGMDELREAKYLAFGRDQPFVDVFNDVGNISWHELPLRPEGYRNQRTPESCS